MSDPLEWHGDKNVLRISSAGHMILKRGDKFCCFDTGGNLRGSTEYRSRIPDILGLKEGKSR